MAKVRLWARWRLHVCRSIASYTAGVAPSDTDQLAPQVERVATVCLPLAKELITAVSSFPFF